MKLTRTIDTKPLIKNERDGNEIVDLTVQSVKGTTNVPTINMILVGKDEEMRIDLISKYGYGSVDFSEKVLKYNGISNPFSIEEGDFLVIPDQIQSNSDMRPASTIDDGKKRKDIRDQYITPEKDSNIDPRFKEFDNRQKPKKPLPGKQGVALPPNFANIGDKEIEVKGGKIYFGPNISRNDKECEEPLSKSEFIAKLIKNKLKKNI